MKTTAHKSKKVKKLPPHSWEVHPLAHKGEANKQLIIALVTIFAIVILIILLFVGKMFVGKAVATINTIYLQTVPNNITENTTFDLYVMANIGLKQTVAIEFELPLPKGSTCADIKLTPQLREWYSLYDLEKNNYCQNDKIIFGYFTLNSTNAKSGSFQIAKINFLKGLSANNYLLSFGENTHIWEMSKEPANLISKSIFNLNVIRTIIPSEICNDLYDNDGDKLADCADPDCAADQACIDVPCELIGQTGCTTNKFDNTIICSPSGPKNVCVQPGCDIPLRKFVESIKRDLDSCPEGYNHFNDGSTSSSLVCANLSLFPTVQQCSGFPGYCWYKENNGLGLCNEREGDCAFNPTNGKVCVENTICDSKIKDGFADTIRFCKANVEEPPAPTEPITISLSNTNGVAIASSTLITANPYHIIVKVTPTTNLPAHLAIVTVTYGSEQSTKFIVNKPALAAETTENLEFVETIPAGKTGTISIQALVWETWPSADAPFESLLSTTKSYTLE